MQNPINAGPVLSTNSTFTKMYVFIDMVTTRVTNGSPDMILTAFDVKFHVKKDEIPPGACRPSKKLKKTMPKKWTSKKLKKQTMSKKWVKKS